MVGVGGALQDTPAGQAASHSQAGARFVNLARGHENSVTVVSTHCPEWGSRGDQHRLPLVMDQAIWAPDTFGKPLIEQLSSVEVGLGSAHIR